MTFKEMTNQELCQIDPHNHEKGVLIALCNELLSRMEVIGTRIHGINESIPAYQPTVHLRRTKGNLLMYAAYYGNKYLISVEASDLDKAFDLAVEYTAESGLDREAEWNSEKLFVELDSFHELTLGTFTVSPDYFRELYSKGEFRAQRVVAAACRTKCLEYTLVSARHWDKGMNRLCKQLDLEDTFWPMEEQGFIDQYGNFLTREQAYIIAKREGQIIRDCNEHGVLYSENLY